MSSEHIVVNCTINGEQQVFLANVRDSLLEALRDRIGTDRRQGGLQQRQLRRLLRQYGWSHRQ